MLAVFKREMRSYFITPIGYIFTGVFLAVSGLLFAQTILLKYDYAGMTTYFIYLMFMFAILLPILTMKLLAEDRKIKTEQILMTAPVPIASVIIAKYLAALALFAATLGVNSLNFFLLYKYGTPNGAKILSNIVGIFLIGAAFIAVGLFLSALTENQLIAAITSMGVTAVLILISFVAESIAVEWLRNIFNWFAVIYRYSNFTGGYFDVAAIIYFISFVTLFIFLTVRVYEKRRWS